MNITKKVSKLMAERISSVTTNIAKTSTKECINMTLEEPKIPKSLLKAK